MLAATAVTMLLLVKPAVILRAEVWPRSMKIVLALAAMLDAIEPLLLTVFELSMVMAVGVATTMLPALSIVMLPGPVPLPVLVATGAVVAVLMVKSAARAGPLWRTGNAAASTAK